jgi:hypothetical protein
MAAGGIVNMNLLPIPTSLSTLILPPDFSMKSLHVKSLIYFGVFVGKYFVT